MAQTRRVFFNLMRFLPSQLDFPGEVLCAGLQRVSLSTAFSSNVLESFSSSVCDTLYVYVLLMP